MGKWLGLIINDAMLQSVTLISDPATRAVHKDGNIYSFRSVVHNYLELNQRKTSDPPSLDHL